MKTAFRENLIKNGIVGFLLIPGYISIYSSISNSGITSDKSTLGSILVAVGILSVMACFGNFTFTYEKIMHGNSNARYLGHVTTGILMLIMGLSLEMTSVITKFLIGSFPVFDLSLFILYISSVLYDFWDLNRAAL